jgi:hypothetical protein
MHRIAKFRRLSPWERKVFLRALLLLPLSAVGLRALGLRRIQAVLARASRAAASADAHSRAEQVVRLVAAAARHGPYRASCLPMSLTLQRLLREAGIPSELRLGVRKVAGRLEAHAWLEHNGEPLTETAEVNERFAAFDAAISPRTGLLR